LGNTARYRRAVFPSSYPAQSVVATPIGQLIPVPPRPQ
jgi:hypothetical protein